MTSGAGVSFPAEVGIYTLNADGTKIAKGMYDGSTRDFEGIEITPQVASMYNKIGDGSDIGFGVLFMLMLHDIEPPPPEEPPYPILLFLQVLTMSVILLQFHMHWGSNGNDGLP